ncbi:MAG TPA: hydroxymethylbilane synthase [Rectinemataceae bacterium]|nr:hydroxymethylbilane synthase [Rectinemataceae bacterium]
MPIDKKSVTIGSRGSALARWQTSWVKSRLEELWPGLEVRVEIFTTSGDRILDKPLPEIGGKGLFTEELERALLAGSIDLAVHSLKDLPVENPVGLTVGAIPERADARDVFISARCAKLSELRKGAKVGTSSLRRGSQLLMLRPDLQLLPLRGNVDTRIGKAMAGEYDAIVLAAAGVTRLGKGANVASFFEFSEMLPAPGQGALGIQCRADDEATLRLLATLDHGPTRSAVLAERAFLLGLGGGCSAPVATIAKIGSTGSIDLEGLVASPDGRSSVRVRGEGSEPLALGKRLAEEALAKGARAILG